MSLCHNLSHMKGGTLEVFLGNAEDIRHTNILGTPVYYVITQLGSHKHRSRVSKGKDAKVTWNEKFEFELPMSHWKRDSHMKFRIMDREFFSDGGFVGETIIHLGGIISEGNYRGLIEVKPAPYNVVLEDDTYKGQIKIGFKFIPHVSMLRREIHPGILTLLHLDKKFNIPRRVNSHHFAE